MARRIQGEAALYSAAVGQRLATSMSAKASEIVKVEFMAALRFGERTLLRVKLMVKRNLYCGKRFFISLIFLDKIGW